MSRDDCYPVLRYGTNGHQPLLGLCVYGHDQMLSASGVEFLTSGFHLMRKTETNEQLESTRFCRKNETEKLEERLEKFEKFEIDVDPLTNFE